MTITARPQKSLHDTMNDMVRKPLRLLEKAVLPGAELDAFAAVDPVLASLRKQMNDARAYYSQLRTQNGRADPMASVAADMADSAASAFETRLIELRQCRAKVRAARRLLKKADEEAEAEHFKSSALYHMRLQSYYIGERNRRDRRRVREQENENWILFLFWSLQLRMERAQQLLSLNRQFMMAAR